MSVFVVMPDGQEMTFGYAPDHYAGVHAYYTEQQQRGKIKSFRIEM